MPETINHFGDIHDRARARSAPSGAMPFSPAEGSIRRQQRRFGDYRQYRQALIMDKLLYGKPEEHDRAGSERLLRATRPGLLHDLFGLEYGGMLYRIEGDVSTVLRVF